MYIIILKEGNETDLRAVYISRASPTHKNNRLNKNLLSRQVLLHETRVFSVHDTQI